MFGSTKTNYWISLFFLLLFIGNFYKPKYEVVHITQAVHYLLYSYLSVWQYNYQPNYIGALLIYFIYYCCIEENFLNYVPLVAKGGIPSLKIPTSNIKIFHGYSAYSLHHFPPLLLLYLNLENSTNLIFCHISKDKIRSLYLQVCWFILQTNLQTSKNKSLLRMTIYNVWKQAPARKSISADGTTTLTVSHYKSNLY